MRLGFRWYDSIFILLFLYLFVLQIHAIWPFTIDDMYISLRYAKHWAAGDGLLWNLHAPRVEGYSNFSFVVLGTLVLMAHGDPVLALKIAGLIGLFFTCLFLFLTSRLWFCTRASFLPCFALLLYKGQIIWAVSGLETAVYEALLCAAVYFAFRGMGYDFFPKSRGKTQNKYFVFAGILLAFAGMTRPEAPALMAVFFILICWDRPKAEGRRYWRGVALFSSTLVLFYLPYFIWRLAYFGFLFPNPVYCKGLSKDFTSFLDVNYLKLIWPFALFALPACILAQDKRHYFLWLPSLLYLLMLVNSDPVVAFANRLFLPAFALLLPLALQGISLILHQKDNFSIVSLYVVFFLAVFLFMPSMTLAQYQYFSQNPLQGERLRKKVVHWLSTHMASGNSVALADSGMIPYFSNLNFIDSYCLNNTSMSHYPKEHRYEQFCNEIVLEKPEVIILTSLIEQGHVMYTPGDQCLQKIMNKHRAYKLTKTFASNNMDSAYRYELFTVQ